MFRYEVEKYSPARTALFRRKEKTKSAPLECAQQDQLLRRKTSVPLYSKKNREYSANAALATFLNELGLAQFVSIFLEERMSLGVMCEASVCDKGGKSWLQANLLELGLQEAQVSSVQQKLISSARRMTTAISVLSDVKEPDSPGFPPPCVRKRKLGASADSS